MKNWNDMQKLEYAMKVNKEIDEAYQLISKLAIVCIRKEIQLIIENPYTPPHYLTERWPIKPKVIDRDRTLNGDKFKKPTQFFFIGCEPSGNVIFEPITYKPVKTIDRPGKTEHGRQTERSMIEPEYANRFIRQYILKGGANDKQ